MTKSSGTKGNLGQAFLEILSEKPFDKITISDITDRVGVIRPTFYNHFEDKYQIFDYILEKDVFSTMTWMFENGLYEEVLRVYFTYFENNRKVYKKAFKIEGQNSFTSLLEQKFQDFCVETLGKYKVRENPKLNVIKNQVIAELFSAELTRLTEMWVFTEDEEVTVDMLVEDYTYLRHHSFVELVGNTIDLNEKKASS